MSELKSEKIYRQNMFGKIFTREVYEKSEADKVIEDKDEELRRQKYKRCLDKAEMCKRKRIDAANYKIPREKWEFYNKWNKRWEKLAEKFKEAK